MSLETEKNNSLFKYKSPLPSESYRGTLASPMFAVVVVAAAAAAAFVCFLFAFAVDVAGIWTLGKV